MYKSIRFLPGRHPLENTHVCRTFELARGFGKKIYLVGGYLRDSIEKIVPKIWILP
jgi:tRNA nucleotidyltransferase/poly(A) polymerase